MSGKKGVLKSPAHRARLSVSVRNSPRVPRGAARTQWKGADASYQAIHQALAWNHPKSGTCSVCGISGGRTEYAFLYHPEPHTRDIVDYRELCPRCHKRMDKSGGTYL